MASNAVAFAVSFESSTNEPRYPGNLASRLYELGTGSPIVVQHGMTPVHTRCKSSSFLRSALSSLGPPTLTFALALSISTFKTPVLVNSAFVGGFLLLSQRSGTRLSVILVSAYNLSFSEVTIVAYP